MKKMRTLLNSVLCVMSLHFLTGCAGLGDYSVDLPGEYSVVRVSAHMVTIAHKEGESSWGSNIIPSKVTELAWDDDYIFAKQLGLKQDPNSNNGIKIPNEDDVHFWILEVKTGEVFGPFGEIGFSEKKNELSISEEIVLKKIEDLR